MGDLPCGRAREQEPPTGQRRTLTWCAARLDGPVLGRLPSDPSNGPPSLEPRHPAPLWRRLRRLRRQGQRILVLPPPLLQPGARPARGMGGARNHGDAARRCHLRSRRGLLLRQLPLALGSSTSPDVRRRSTGVGVLLPAVEPSAGTVAAGAARVSRRGRDRRADARRLLRDPQLGAGGRAHGRLPRANVAPELPLLLRLVGGPHDGGAGVRGVPPARRGPSRRRAQSGGLSPLRARGVVHHVRRDPGLGRRDTPLHSLPEEAPRPGGASDCAAQSGRYARRSPPVRFKSCSSPVCSRQRLPA